MIFSLLNGAQGAHVWWLDAPRWLTLINCSS